MEENEGVPDEIETGETPDHIYMKGSEKYERFLVICRRCDCHLSMPCGIKASWANDLIAEFIGAHAGCADT